MRFLKSSCINLFACLLLTLAFSPFTYSTQQISNKNPIEVYTITASKLPSLSFTAHSVLSREEIELLNPISTTQLLRNVPGIIISENSNGAGQSFITVRGGESNFTLVMIDGIIVNDPTNSRGGGFDYNQLDPSVIERIEVYRGGISAIYGSDAISGVIQFFTRRGAEAAVQMTGGNKNQQAASAIGSHAFSDELNGLVNVSFAKRHDSKEENYSSQQLLMKLDADYKNFQHDVFFSYGSRTSNSFPEDSGGNLFASPFIAEQRDNKLSLAGLQTRYIPNKGRYLQRVQSKISWNHQKETAVNPGIAEGILSGIPASNITSDYEKWASELNTFWELSPKWQLVLGAGALKATGKNDGSLDFGFPLPVDFTLTREIYSAFGEINGTIGGVELNVGARFEDPNNFDSDIAARIGISKRFTNKLIMHSSYSEGYKLPSFFALAHPLVGNADLKPEESENFELGIDVDLNSETSMQLTYFYNEYKNLVDFDAKLFTSVNRQSVTSEGLEWQVLSTLNSWLSFQFDLTYSDTDVNTQNLNEDITLRRRPKWTGGGFVSAQWGEINTTLSVDTRSRFRDSAIPTGACDLGGFTQVNLSSNWQYSDQLILLLAIDNLFDKDFQESIGFTSPGVAYRVGFRFQLD